MPNPMRHLPQQVHKRHQARHQSKSSVASLTLSRSFCPHIHRLESKLCQASKVFLVLQDLLLKSKQLLALKDHHNLHR